MSIWYDLDVKAIAKDKTAVAKFFNLDDDYKDVRTDRFEFSFGGKNAPSLTLRKVVQQNPDLVFLVKQSIECDTVEWFITNFDVSKNEQQLILIQDFGSVTNKVSKKLLEEYHEKYPRWLNNHLEGKKGQENFLWDSFITDFDRAVGMLNHSEEYKERVNPWKHFNVKNYIIEYECNYGTKDEPMWHKEWQGPHPVGKIESIKEKFNSRSEEIEIRNLSIREVEPK